MKDANRRDYYRIDYPDSHRPRLWVPFGCLEVLDCSETGLRYRLSGEPAPEVGAEVEGRLRLGSGRDLRVHGRVTRVREDAVALDLSEPGIPFRVILQEQIHLRRCSLPPEAAPRAARENPSGSGSPAL